MKEGAGEDPFADSESDSDLEQDPKENDSATFDKDETHVDSISNENQSVDIPYKFRRDSVQDGRDRVPLFLQSDTKTAERQAIRDLENRFDDDISMTDLREALVKVGLANLDETAETLKEWGYGLTFE